MIFSVVILLIVLAITYLHYLQGAFTAAISLGCAFMAALVAFGYYENVLNMVGGGKYGDISVGAIFIILFIVTYTVLRTLFDSIVPGNLALPLYVERGGAAVFGFMAGIIAGGMLAITAQLLPFGPSVAGYAKFEVRDRDVIVPKAAGGGNRDKDTAIQNEMVSDTLDPAAASSLLLPVDNIVLSLISLSSDGAYAGTQSFAEIHPDLTTEAFGARLGTEHSGNRLAINSSKAKPVSVTGVFTLPPTVTGADSEITEIRPSTKAITFKPESSNTLIVVRVAFEATAADKDAYVRITPAAMRLHITGADYRPIGTMDTAVKIALSRVDDQLPIPIQGAVRAADFVFDVPKLAADDLIKGGAGAKSAFIEAKLLGRVSLAAVPVEPYTGPGNTVGVARKVVSPLRPPAVPAAR